MVLGNVAGGYDFYIFDLDGTLCDTLPDIAAALNAALKEAGHAERSPEQVRSYLGEGARDLVHKASGAPDAQLDDLVERYRANYRKSLVAGTRLYDGVREKLAALGAPAAVLTNKPGTEARAILEALGIASHFVAIIGDGDGHPRKPDPASLQELIANAGAKRALYVGDSDIDEATAERANVDFVYADYGYGTIINEARTISRFADLPSR